MALFTSYVNSVYATLPLDKVRAQYGEKDAGTYKKDALECMSWSALKETEETKQMILSASSGAVRVCEQVIKPISILFFVTVN